MRSINLMLGAAVLLGCSQGPQGEQGPQGVEGPAGPAGTSCTVASNGDGTATIACGDGTSALIGQPPRFHDVRDHGAVGDGVADDTAAIQDALDAVTDGGTVYLGPGIYRTTGTVAVGRNRVTVHGDSAKILAAHDGIALDISPPEGTSWIMDVSVRGFLEIEKAAPDSADGSVGIRLRNAYHCVLEGFSVSSFSRGVVLFGQGSGCVYNRLEPRELHNNTIQMHFTTAPRRETEPEGYPYGWSNQNTVIGGRWWFGSTFESAGGTPTHVFLEYWESGTERSSPNGNLFLHLSLESGCAPCAWAVVCEGDHNTFIAPRTEHRGGTPEAGDGQWFFSSQSNDNVLQWPNLHGALIEDHGTGNSHP